MFNGVQNEREATMEKIVCVWMHACVQSHVNVMAPLREVGHDQGGQWVEAAISGGCHSQKEHATSMATLGLCGSAGSRHTISA